MVDSGGGGGLSQIGNGWKFKKHLSRKKIITLAWDCLKLKSSLSPENLPISGKMLDVEIKVQVVCPSSGDCHIIKIEFWHRQKCVPTIPVRIVSSGHTFFSQFYSFSISSSACWKTSIECSMYRFHPRRSSTVLLLRKRATASDTSWYIFSCIFS